MTRHLHRLGAVRVAMATVVVGALACTALASFARWTDSQGRPVSLDQAALLYGTGCGDWDDDGDGCGAGGCAEKCDSFSPSTLWAYKSGDLTSTNCNGGTDDTCGKYENVDQTKCGSS